ncbi:MAG: hypothetical protein ACFFAY_12930 [Promethearchaeota archaeon]
MLPFTENSRYVFFILSLVLLIGLIIPITVVHVAGYPSHLAALRGQPIVDTFFAELVELEPDPVVFPQRPVVETETSIRMSSNYNDLVKVNESGAISAALGFISRIWYLSEINFSVDSVDMGWTRLDDGLWILRFLEDNVQVYVDVHAISGKVSGFTSVWSPRSDSPFVPDADESLFASPMQVEEVAFDFLEQFNYSLSPYARYVLPTLVYSHVHNHDVFRISFFNMVNESLIWQNGLHLYIDTNASAILEFIYNWVHIDAIPTENIISPEKAERSAVNYLRELEAAVVFEIRSTVLVFEKMWTPSGYEYRLGWIVSINSDNIAAIHIDAKSGTPYDTAWYGLLDAESPDSPFSLNVPRLPISLVIWMFMVSALIGFAVSLAARKQARLSHIT